MSATYDAEAAEDTRQMNMILASFQRDGIATKTDAEKVREIRKAFSESPSSFISKAWADKYGVNLETIRRVIKCSLWKESESIET